MFSYQTTAKALVLAVFVFGFFGCRESANPLYRRHFQPKPWKPLVQKNTATPLDQMEEGEILSKIQSVAVLPFLDETYGRNNTLNQDDSIHIAEELASHLIGSKTFKTILYPLPCLEKISHTNLSIKNSDDIKEIANILGVDAIIFGVINQYTMYYPPQLSVSMKFYLTRLDRFAASTEISALAHSGVPLYQYNPTFFRQLWDSSAFYHGSSTIVKKKLKRYTKLHDLKFYGFREDRVFRTKADFLNFIAYDLSCSLNLLKKFNATHKPASIKKGPKGYHTQESYY